MTGTQQSQKTIYCSLVFIVNFVLLSCFHFNGVFRHIVGLQLVQRYITLCCVLNCVLMCVSAHFEIRAGRAVVYFLLQSFSINYYNMLHVFFSTSEGEEAVLLKERLKERKGLIGRVVFFLFIFFVCVFIINNNGSSCPLEQTTWSIYSVFFSSSFFVHDF